MRKIIFFIISFLFIFSSVASACDFKISNFGDPKKDYSTMKIPVDGGVLPMIPPVIMPDQFGGEIVFIPTEDICVNEKSLYGTVIDYLYVDNKLVQITISRSLMNDKNLLDYAMKKFGSFNLPKGIKKIDWRGNYNWESGNDDIQYISADMDGSQIEILQINSKLYADLMQEYRERIIEWLEPKN